MTKNWSKKIKIERKSWKMPKIEKNSKNVKIEMRSFGMLKWSQWSQKLCSEQLRSSSIDGSCQMVRTGTIKFKKGQFSFGRFDNASLLTDDFLMFWCPRGLWKLQFRHPKLIFVHILINNIFFHFFHFVFCIFLHTHFWILLTISLKK